jgi:hypothetical protein
MKRHHRDRVIAAERWLFGSNNVALFAGKAAEATACKVAMFYLARYPRRDPVPWRRVWAYMGGKPGRHMSFYRIICDMKNPSAMQEMIDLWAQHLETGSPETLPLSETMRIVNASRQAPSVTVGLARGGTT